MNAKQIATNGLNFTLRHTKRMVKSNPKLKGFLQANLGKHIGLNAWQPTSMAREFVYAKWVENNYPDAIELRRQQNEAEKFTYKPVISIAIPTYNTNHTFLKECIESIQSQSYPFWELCITDDKSPDAEVRNIIKQYARDDSRIKYTFRKKNGHISEATNDAIKLAEGEYVGLVDHDDILWPNALFEVAKALNKDKKIDFLYSDEDKVTENRHTHKDPFFKPDWNPDFLHCVNCITHFAVIRKSLVEKAGGLQTKYNGAQDWDLFLRVSNLTNKIHHIPTILYSWRISETSTALSTDTKPYVYKAQKHAIEDDLARKGYKDAYATNDINKDYWRVVYPIKGNPKVSIVIPTKNELPVLKKCLESVEKKTTYDNYEVIIVDTGSTGAKIRRFYKKLKTKGNYKIVDFAEKPFSYSRACNEGARHARGEFLLMLNNDTEVVTRGWVQMLVGDAQRKEIGAVGCKLYYTDGYRIQHAGVWIGPTGTAAHILPGVADDGPKTLIQHLYANTRHNITSVTAACMMIEKKKFDAVGGFDEHDFKVTYNDIDLCLKLVDKGFRNLYTPFVNLLHHESLSLGNEKHSKRDKKELTAASKAFKKKWGKYVDHDPSFNPNLDKQTALLNIADIE